MNTHPKKYIPKVNDYVIWTNYIEGWVYFKCNEYITIEMSVKPKDEQNIKDCSLHKNDRVLVLCYTHQWKELTYCKTRISIHDNTSI